ncbi:MAG TPA: UbiA-like polyprenyltransferase [Candidatus Polarisedimenticolaceae bacterium]|nr:UbiA-like polyprenyltransferase [Candidatus Polarisedimenticolaceae bacterium]
MSGALDTVRLWGRMVKFSHSVFALPFALSGVALAATHHGVTARQLGWIVVAMVAARNAAMGFNRLADHALDARNPRTAARELPSGRLRRGAVWSFTLALAALFLFAAARLGPLCGALGPLALAIVFAYSYTKRFTWASHLVLGLALAMAPVGGWVALAGRFSATAWMLALAVLSWVAGFDVIYACQDVDFDRSAGLHSIPARFGVRRALGLARLLHAVTAAGLAAVGLLERLHPIYWLGWAAIVALLGWEHRLVRPGDLSRLGAAFFNMNGVIGVLYLATVLVAVLLPRLVG